MSSDGVVEKYVANCCEQGIVVILCLNDVLVSARQLIDVVRVRLSIVAMLLNVYCVAGLELRGTGSIIIAIVLMDYTERT